MVGHGWVSWVLCGWAAAVLAASCGEAKQAEIAGPTSAMGGAEANGGSPGSAGSGEPSTPDALPLLGQKCSADAQCGGDGLRCLTATEDFMAGQGAPPGGVCTADCATDADCRAFDASAVCATLAEAPLELAYAAKPVPRLCMQGCSLGAPSGAAKCHGRGDFACRPFGPASPTTCFMKEPCA